MAGQPIRPVGAVLSPDDFSKVYGESSLPALQAPEIGAALSPQDFQKQYQGFDPELSFTQTPLPIRSELMKSIFAETSGMPKPIIEGIGQVGAGVFGTLEAGYQGAKAMIGNRSDSPLVLRGARQLSNSLAFSQDTPDPISLLKHPSVEGAARFLMQQVPVFGAMGLGAALGGPVGLFAASYMINTGNLYSDLRDRGVDAPLSSLAAGVPLSFLDMYGFGKVFGRETAVPLAREMAKLGYGKFAAQFMKSIASRGWAEATEEMGQEIIQIFTEAAQGVNDDGMTNLVRVINSGLGGAFAGGAFGSVTSGVESFHNQEGPPPELDMTPEPEPTEPPQVENVSTPPAEPAVPAESTDVDITPSVEPVGPPTIQDETIKIVPELSDTDLQELVAKGPKLPDVYKDAVKAEVTRRKTRLEAPSKQDLGLADLSVKKLDELVTALDTQDSTGSDLGVATSMARLVAAKYFKEKNTSGLGTVAKVLSDTWVGEGLPRAYAGAVGQVESLVQHFKDELASKAVAPIRPDFDPLVEQTLQQTQRDPENVVRYLKDKAQYSINDLRNAPKILTDYNEVPVITTYAADNNFAKEFTKSTVGKTLANFYSTQLERAVDLLSSTPEAINPIFRKAGEYIAGVGFVVDDRVLGRFETLTADAARSLILVNPFYSSGEAQAFTEPFDTFVHELTHLAALHEPSIDAGENSIDISDFPGLLAQNMQALRPLQEPFEEEFNAIVRDPSRHNGLNPDLTRFARAFSEYKTETPVNQAASSPGSTPGRASSGRSGIGGPAGGTNLQGPSAQGEGGAAHGGISQEILDGRKGDYPAPSPEYEAGIQQYRANAKLDSDSTYEPESTHDPLAEHFDRVAKGLKLSKEATENIKQDRIKFQRTLAKWMTLIQIAKRNLDIKPLQHYLEFARGFWRTKTSVTMQADKILRQINKKLGRIAKNNLSSLIYEVMDISTKESRRLSLNEIRTLATKHRVPDSDVKLYQDIDKSLQDILTRLYDTQIRSAQDTLGPLARLTVEHLQAEKESLLNRNFFPATRFGNKVVFVKANEDVVFQGESFKKGATIAFETFEDEKSQEERYAELKRKVGRKPIQVKMDVVDEEAAPFMSFSPTLYDMLSSSLSMTNDQRIRTKELLYKFSPGRSFVKHMMKKRGIAGWGQDALRAYADYAQHASNHLARMEYKDKFLGAIKELKQLANSQTNDSRRMREMQSFLERHYKDLMNPTNSLAGLRAGLFTYFFAIAPKQALVNFIQVPLFAFSWLAKRHGGPPGIADALTARLLGGAIKDAVASYIKADILTDDEWRMLQQAEEENLTDQSFASEAAATAANQSIFGQSSLVPKWLEKRWDGAAAADYYGRQFMEKSTYLFDKSEKLNRRIVALAAFRLAQRQGKSYDDSFKFMREGIETTMFEYAAWNRPEIMKGNKSIIFVFKLFQQHALAFTLMNEGGWRFYLGMLAMTGVAGFFGGEDALDIVDLLGSLFGKHAGWKNPRVDSRKWIAERAEAMGIHPDLMLHGAAAGFGLTPLEWLFGQPMPTFDLSSSLSFGRILPGVGPLTRYLQGTTSGDSALLRTLSEIGGAATPIGVNTFNAIMDNTPAGLKALTIAPSFIRNVTRGLYALQEGAVVNSRGEKLVPIDFNNPQHVGEFIGMLMGVYPRRASRESAVMFAAAEQLRYYIAWREQYLYDLTRAIKNQDREGITAANKALGKFNEQAPPEFVLGFKQARQSVRKRLENQTLREMGLPTQKRYVSIYRQYRQAFQVPKEPLQPPAPSQ